LHKNISAFKSQVSGLSHRTQDDWLLTAIQGKRMRTINPFTMSPLRGLFYMGYHYFLKKGGNKHIYDWTIYDLRITVSGSESTTKIRIKSMEYPWGCRVSRVHTGDYNPKLRMPIEERQTLS
jgi:hypothetical protein